MVELCSPDGRYRQGAEGGNRDSFLCSHFSSTCITQIFTTLRNVCHSVDTARKLISTNNYRSFLFFIIIDTDKENYSQKLYTSV